jgi:multicomponent Na+:H+ antiporter subunit B
MRGVGALLVAITALVLVIGVAGLPPHTDLASPAHGHVGERYLLRGVEETGLRNLVTATLLVYRGFDTFLEVVVIVTALLAVTALPRSTLQRRAPDAAAATPVSPVVFFVVRLLAPFIAVFALASLYGGHVTPGGGFQSAAILGALFIALALVLGSERAERSVPRGARPWLQAAGPLAFALVAFVGWRLTGAFLGYPAHAEGLREAMVVTLEVAIAVGGAVVLAQLFLALEG